MASGKVDGTGNQNKTVTITNLNSGINSMRDGYKTLIVNKTVGYLYLFLSVNTEVPGWSKICNIADLKAIGVHNFTVTAYDSPTKAIWLYLEADGLYTRDALPKGRYVVSETYMRND